MKTCQQRKVDQRFDNNNAQQQYLDDPKTAEKKVLRRVCWNERRDGHNNAACWQLDLTPKTPMALGRKKGKIGCGVICRNLRKVRRAGSGG